MMTHVFDSLQGFPGPRGSKGLPGDEGEKVSVIYTCLSSRLRIVRERKGNKTLFPPLLLPSRMLKRLERKLAYSTF